MNAERMVNYKSNFPAGTRAFRKEPTVWIRRRSNQTSRLEITMKLCFNKFHLLQFRSTCTPISPAQSCGKQFDLFGLGNSPFVKGGLTGGELIWDLDYSGGTKAPFFLWVLWGICRPSFILESCAANDERNLQTQKLGHRYVILSIVFDFLA